MIDRPDEERLTERDKQALKRLVRAVAAEEPDAEFRPADETVLAYLYGDADAAEREAVEGALLRSASFRRALRDMGGDLAALESGDLDAGFAAAPPPRMPNWEDFPKERLETAAISPTERAEAPTGLRRRLRDFFRSPRRFALIPVMAVVVVLVILGVSNLFGPDHRSPVLMFDSPIDSYRGPIDEEENRFAWPSTRGKVYLYVPEGPDVMLYKLEVTHESVTGKRRVILASADYNVVHIENDITFLALDLDWGQDGGSLFIELNEWYRQIEPPRLKTTRRFSVGIPEP